MDNKEMKLSPALAELERAYDSFNVSLFNGLLLERPVITIQTRGRRAAAGWFYADSWKDTNSGELTAHEINISAEYMKTADLNDLYETLIHEMVHQLNRKQGIKGTSRGGNYHNKHFKKEAENAGLVVEKSEKYGWAYTKLGEAALRAVNAHKPNYDVFNGNVIVLVFGVNPPGYIM